MMHRVKKKNDENHDKWVGPGGKLEAGETPLDCVKREVLEETGLSLIEPQYRGIITFISDIWGTEIMHLYTAGEYTGVLKDCDEGNLEWIPVSKVYELPIWEGDKIFFRLLENGEPFFELELVYCGDTLTRALLNGKLL